MCNTVSDRPQARNAKVQSVAKYIARTLRRSNVECMFGYPGQSNLQLLQAAKSEGIRYVQTADERSAGFAAAGYTESSGAPAVVCVSKGPATTNLLTSLMSARLDGVPILAISGNVAQACHGRNSFQEFDPATAFAASGAVKRARYVDSPEHVPAILSELVRFAWSEPHGPTLLDLPYTLLSGALDVRAEPIVVPERIAALASEHSRREVQRAADCLQRARRPVVVVGRGARRDYRHVRAFIEAADLPAVHTMGGTGVIVSSDPRYGGFLRHTGSSDAAYLVQNADVVLALGTGLDDRATAHRPTFAPNAVKIQVDLDPAALGRTIPLDIAINESVCAVLTELDACMSRQVRRRDNIDELRAWRRSEPRAMATGDVLGAREIVDVASEALGDAIAVKDSGSHKYWVTQYAPCSHPRKSIASCHFGSMGFGLPAAVGASIANPGTPVVAVCGDGCVLMSSAELRTAAQERCDNLKVIVFNNGGLGSTRDFEHRIGASDRVISDFDRHADCAAIAESMGMPSHTISRREDLPILSRGLLQGGLALFDCHIDPAEPKSPSVPYTRPLDAMLEDERLKRSA